MKLAESWCVPDGRSGSPLHESEHRLLESVRRLSTLGLVTSFGRILYIALVAASAVLANIAGDTALQIILAFTAMLTIAVPLLGARDLALRGPAAPEQEEAALARMRRAGQEELAKALPEDLVITLHLVSSDASRRVGIPQFASAWTNEPTPTLVTGPPGAGKTTLLLHVWATMLRDLEADTSRVPVIIRAVDLAGPSQMETVVSEALWRDFNIKRSLVRSWVGQRRLALLIDGVDELAEPTRKWLLAQIDDWVKIFDGKVLITDREDRPELSEFRHWQTEGLTPDEVLAYLGKRLGHSESELFETVRKALYSDMRGSMTPLELRTLLAMIARNRNDAPGRQLLPSAPSLPELGDVFATLNAAEELLLRSMKPGVPYRVADIASRARLVPSMVATALASLTDKGLVARLPPKGKVVSNEDLFDSTFIRIGAASGDSAA